MADVPMPAWMRKIQQGYIWQKIAIPTFVGFGGALILQGCLTHGLENIGQACVMAAVDAWILSLITAWVQGHSPGSAAFASNGTPIAAVPVMKEMVDNAIVVHEKAQDAASPVRPVDAVKASAAVESASTAVSAYNAIVKTALANEAK